MLLVNNGSGALTITTSGAVTGETNDGILANNSQNSTDLTIEVDNVTGGAPALTPTTTAVAR
jgi:autotransporter family porin